MRTRCPLITEREKEKKERNDQINTRRYSKWTLFTDCEFVNCMMLFGSDIRGMREALTCDYSDKLQNECNHVMKARRRDVNEMSTPVLIMLKKH